MVGGNWQSCYTPIDRNFLGLSCPLDTSRWWPPVCHKWELPDNNPYFQKNGNLPLCLENSEGFSLPHIFTKKNYIYALHYIIYLGEPSGNIISNYYRTFIHISMHGYDPILKIYINCLFCQCCHFICQCIFSLANVTSKTLSFFTI